LALEFAHTPDSTHAGLRLPLVSRTSVIQESPTADHPADAASNSPHTAKYNNRFFIFSCFPLGVG
jgi:hypothetical protein